MVLLLGGGVPPPQAGQLGAFSGPRVLGRLWVTTEEEQECALSTVLLGFDASALSKAGAPLLAGSPADL